MRLRALLAKTFAMKRPEYGANGSMVLTSLQLYLLEVVDSRFE
jgi:hypothetical protein